MTEIEISKKLQMYIDEANTSFGEGKQYVINAYNQALKDGLTAQQAKELLLDKITVFKKSTIYACLPDEAKKLTKPKKIPKLESQSEKRTVSQGYPHDASNIVPDTRKYSEDPTPEPLARDPTPEHPQPTEEPEESYKGDAGNNPELIAKYVSDPAQPLVIHIEVPKFFGQLFAANRNNTGAYLYIKDMEVYKVEADNVHKVEVKSK